MSGLPEVDGVENLSEIGRGGFGVVYRGTETEFDRTVAIKVLMPSLDERTQRRFERERRAMGAVSGHPNIVTVYRGGVTPSHQPYLVMEYLRGGSLSDRLRDVGPVDWREAGLIGAKLADALAVAHRAGILHRDVKPGNVFQTHAGEPKLGDFGIARLDDGNDSRSGSITASVAHAPPEIVDGQRGDERSDMYSLASTVYALAMGAAPFARDPDQGLTRMLARIATEQPPALHLESAADDFEAVLRRGLSKRPEDRFATVTEFGAALRQAVAVPVRPDPPPATSQSFAASEVTTAPAPAPVPEATVGDTAAGRRSSPVQLIGFALLALAIAGFGGWAVARAVFNNDSGDTVVQANQATAVPANNTNQTIDEAPTVAPPTAQPVPPEAPAAPTPRPEPTAPPEPTQPPAATPTPGAGSRGSALGPLDASTFVSVSDPSGAITVSVPEPWTSIQQTAEDPIFDDLDFSFRGLAVGGRFSDLGGDPEARDLTKSGISIFVARIEEPAEDVGELLDVSLQQWTDCEPGDRSQILLDDGNAEFQILACDRPDGETSGVVVLALIPRDDAAVTVSVNLQFAEFNDLSALPTVIGSLRIDSSKVEFF